MTPDTFPSIPDIAARLKLKRAGRHWRGRCPLCGKDAFSLTENGAKLLVYCFAGCAAKTILAELRKLAPCAAPHRPVTHRMADPPPPPTDWSPRAEALWGLGAPVAGSIVEAYLRERRCALPQSDEIRFLPAGPFGPFPCMMARVTDAITALPITLHFTRLAQDGSGKAAVDRQKLLLTGHRKAGGVIRLTEDAEVTMGLGLAEGIETALSVMDGGWSPVWATVDAGNMAAFPLIDGIESLTLFADNDASGTGRKSAEACRARWRAAGRDAGIVMPLAIGTDWNDERVA